MDDPESTGHSLLKSCQAAEAARHVPTAAVVQLVVKPAGQQQGGLNPFTVGYVEGLRKARRLIDLLIEAEGAAP